MKVIPSSFILKVVILAAILSAMVAMKTEVKLTKNALEMKAKDAQFKKEEEERAKRIADATKKRDDELKAKNEKTKAIKLAKESRAPGKCEVHVTHKGHGARLGDPVGGMHPCFVCLEVTIEVRDCRKDSEPQSTGKSFPKQIFYSSVTHSSKNYADCQTNMNLNVHKNSFWYQKFGVSVDVDSAGETEGCDPVRYIPKDKWDQVPTNPIVGGNLIRSPPRRILFDLHLRHS